MDPTLQAAGPQAVDAGAKNWAMKGETSPISST